MEWEEEQTTHSLDPFQGMKNDEVLLAVLRY
jgi:hypothetical protein